jgi:hypothetical protein
LLTPAAVLILPPFKYQTVAGDKLETVASRFGVPLKVLGDQPANGTIKDLFALTTDGKSTPNLDIPHLDQLRLDALIGEAQRALALQHLSGMASRYYLHGMRLPTHDITPKTPGMWVRPDPDKKDTWLLPPVAGLFALTGQQLQIPTLQEKTSFTFTLDRSAGPSWLLFEDKDQKPTNTLTVSIAPGSTDANRITSVTSYAQQTRLNVKLDSLGAEPMYESHPASYSFTSSLIWQSTGPVTCPPVAAPAASRPSGSGGCRTRC